MRPVPASAGRARRFLADTLDGWGCDAEIAEVATLLVSELVTNAVLHAHSDVSVVVGTRGRVLRVSVHDTSPATPVLRHHDVDAMTGRGLALVAGLARTWGIEHDPDGKVVWFEIAATPADSPNTSRASVPRPRRP